MGAPNPILQEFRSKYNAYHDVPDDVLARRVMATYPGLYDEALGAIARPPQPAVAQPSMVQQALGGLTKAVGTVFPVGGSPRMEMGGRTRPFAGPEEMETARDFQRMGAQAVLPQDEVELATDLALGSAGRLVRGAKKGTQVFTRLAAGTGGGGAGAMVQGSDPAEGATRGFLATGTGEVAGPVATKIARSVPGAKKAILENDAARYGEWIESVVPILKGARSSKDLAAMAREGTGKATLNDYFGLKLAEADTLIGRRVIDVPALGGRMNLREAQDKLAEVGHAGFGGEKADPASRTVVGRDDRRVWAEAVTEIEKELTRLDRTGKALEAFRDGRTQFSRGVTILRSIRKGDTFIDRPNRTDLNTTALQQRTSNAASLYKERFTPGQVQALDRALYRGGGFHTKDDLAPTGGGFWDPLRDVWGQGKGGASQIPGALFRTLIPNVGSRYTGQTPRSISPDQQTLLDVLMSHVMSRGGQQ